MQGLRRHAGLVQQFHEARGDQRSRFRRFRHHGIAGRERSRHLAGKDRQGKIPGADAGEHAASVQGQLVRFAGGALQPLRVGELLPRPHRVVAAKVHGLTDLRDGVGDGLARLPHQEFMKLRTARFQQVRRPVETGCARIAAAQIPRGLGRGAGVECHRDFRRSRVAHAAHDIAPIRRVGDRAGASRQQDPIDDGSGNGRGARLGPDGAASRPLPAQRLDVGRIAQIDPARVAAVGVQRGGQGQPRMRIGFQALDLGDRIANDLGHRHLLVHEAIHERGIRAVLEQSPHQVRQQVLVLAHGRVHADSRKFSDLARRLGIQEPAHAVQPLKFIVRAGRRQFQHRGDAVGIVGRELRINHIRMAEQAAGAGQVGHIRGDFARVHRIALETPFLRALDFRIPVRAFHQAHGHAPAVGARGRRRPVDHSQGAFAVGLHGQA